MGQMNRVGEKHTAVFTDPADGMTKVIYHRTCVVAFDASKIVLNTGGWWSATTKARMNQASAQYNLGYRVYAKKHVWYVSFAGDTRLFEGGIVLRRGTASATA